MESRKPCHEPKRTLYNHEAAMCQALSPEHNFLFPDDFPISIRQNTPDRRSRRIGHPPIATGRSGELPPRNPPVQTGPDRRVLPGNRRRDRVSTASRPSVGSFALARRFCCDSLGLGYGFHAHFVHGHVDHFAVECGGAFPLSLRFSVCVDHPPAQGHIFLGR